MQTHGLIKHSKSIVIYGILSIVIYGTPKKWVCWVGCAKAYNPKQQAPTPFPLGYEVIEKPTNPGIQDP